MGNHDAGLLSRVKTQEVKDIINIAWPVLIELVLSSLFGMINMMMLGNIADQDYAAAAVAAVGVTNQPLFLGLAVVQALNVGGTALVARYYGAGKKDRMENVMKHVMVFSLCFSVPLAIAGFFFSDQIMAFMGAQGETITIGRPYFQIVCLSYLFQSFNFSIAGSLRGIGETKVTMRNNVMANVFDVIGNFLLIYGFFGLPALGVAGAGISTAVSKFLSCVLLVRYLRSGKSEMNFSFRHPFTFSGQTIRNLVHIGLPSAVEQLVLRVGVILFIQVVSGLGTVVFAAHQIGMSILSLTFTMGQAFGISSSALVGQSLGANDTDRAEKYAKITSNISSVAGFLLGLVLFFGSEQIVGLYSNDPAIIESAGLSLKMMAFIQPFQAHQLVVVGSLRGAGDTRFPLMATFIGVLAIRVFFANIFVKEMGLGLMGAWLAIIIDQFVRWILIDVRFRTGKWKKIRIQ